MTTKEFASKVSMDKDLQAKLEAASSIDEYYAIAKENGLTDTFEEFKAVADEFKEMGAKLAAKDAGAENISLDDLSSATGGDAADWGWAAI